MSKQRPLEMCCLCDRPRGEARERRDLIVVETDVAFRLGSLEFDAGDEVGPVCPDCCQAMEQLGLFSEESEDDNE